MNYTLQSRKVKPTAKACMWCRHNKLFTIHIEGEPYDYQMCEIDDLNVNHRLELKMIKENDFRYCKKYRFSKENFKNWKEWRITNERNKV